MLFLKLLVTGVLSCSQRAETLTAVSEVVVTYLLTPHPAITEYLIIEEHVAVGECNYL